MNEEDLKDALDGLFAYDGGAVSSGIRDETLRMRCRDYLRSLGDSDRRVLLARIGRELYLTDAKLAQRYGLEDIAQFSQWLEDQRMA